MQYAVHLPQGAFFPVINEPVGGLLICIFYRIEMGVFLQDFEVGNEFVETMDAIKENNSCREGAISHNGKTTKHILCVGDLAVSCQEFSSLVGGIYIWHLRLALFFSTRHCPCFHWRPDA